MRLNFRNLVLAVSLFISQGAYAQFSAQQTWVPVVGGTANAITLSLPNVSSAKDVIGVPLRIITGGAANTSSVTVTVNAFPALPIKKINLAGLVVLAGGELPPNTPVELISDGNEYVIHSPSPPVFASLTSASLQYFSTSGTFTADTGISGIYVQCWGGGGGGAGGTAGGGGGAGEYRAGVFAPPASPVTVTDGTGGSAGTNGNPGGAGTSTSFGSLITAQPGSGGTQTASNPNPGGAGGTGGTGGSTAIAGHAGGPGFIGTGSIYIGGSGGGAYGTSGTSINLGQVGGASAMGNTPGGGATGNNVSGSGGSGGSGACLVEELL